ncbi:DUF2000 domain-containing protein [Nocardioides sp. NPDC023903]|uniref:DUF2000 domain-containing protein n=1 Tax=Nocardioides sp. NPDC023903 TaxID=3157195 RepID=UPI0034071319
MSSPAAPPAQRVVLVVREDLPVGQAVNAGTVLGASVGSLLELPLGAGGADASGTSYGGIVTTPVPVLAAGEKELTRLFRAANIDERLVALSLTETARRARTYEVYLASLADTDEADLDIAALIVAGPRNRVTRATKHLPLFGADSA